MKYLSVLLISILFSAASFARDLHFIYIRLDNSMNAEILKTQIGNLKDSFADSSDFVLYYSNENMTMDKQSLDIRRLFGQISSQNSSIPVSIPDEIENISVPLEKQLQAESYGAVYFDCFVGNEFQNKLFARMLIVNSLSKSGYELSLRYFPCGAALNEKQTEFNSEYNIDIKTEIISAL